MLEPQRVYQMVTCRFLFIFLKMANFAVVLIGRGLGVLSVCVHSVINSEIPRRGARGVKEKFLPVVREPWGVGARRKGRVFFAARIARAVTGSQFFPKIVILVLLVRVLCVNIQPPHINGSLIR
jgi:hypothetical protein